MLKYIFLTAVVMFTGFTFFVVWGTAWLLKNKNNIKWLITAIVILVIGYIGGFILWWKLDDNPISRKEYVITIKDSDYIEFKKDVSKQFGGEVLNPAEKFRIHRNFLFSSEFNPNFLNGQEIRIYVYTGK